MRTLRGGQILRVSTSILGICAIGWLLVGCDKIGQTPGGGSDADVKAAFDKLPIEKRVKIEMMSPAPMDMKRQRIKDMYAKEGKPVPADILQDVGDGAPPRTAGGTAGAAAGG